MFFWGVKSSSGNIAVWIRSSDRHFVNWGQQGCENGTAEHSIDNKQRNKMVDQLGCWGEYFPLFQWKYYRTLNNSHPHPFWISCTLSQVISLRGSRIFETEENGEEPCLAAAVEGAARVVHTSIFIPHYPSPSLSCSSPSHRSLPPRFYLPVLTLTLTPFVSFSFLPPNSPLVRVFRFLSSSWVRSIADLIPPPPSPLLQTISLVPRRVQQELRSVLPLSMTSRTFRQVNQTLPIPPVAHPRSTGASRMRWCVSSFFSRARTTLHQGIHPLVLWRFWFVC